jgi:RNA polymerase sigma-70 factor (ECF subfamily)
MASAAPPRDGATLESLAMGVRPTRARDAKALKGLPDEQLIAQMSRADPQAFEVLYQRHATLAYSLAYRIMGTAGAAEDVTQDAFLSAWRGATRYDAARGSVRTWLLGIVQHRAVDALRRRNPRERREISDDGLAERLESPGRTDEQVADRQQADAVRALLAGLPHEQRQVIVLAYFRGFTQTEIADVVDAPLGTVKGRMRLALDKLRDAALAAEVGP